MRTRSTEARIVELLPSVYALQTLDAFPKHVLPLVQALIGGDKAHYTEVDLDSGDFRVLVDPEPPQLAGLADARRAHMHENPLLRHYLATRSDEARMTSDFLSRVEYRRLALYGEFFRHLGVEDQLAVTVTHRTDRTAAAIAVDRGRRSFTKDHRHALELLRPHLVAARANAAAFSRAISRPPEAHQSASIDRLTHRQMEILGRIAEGRTNQQIALDLTISPGTVRKHVEHILRRLDVSTRTAAAALLLTSQRGGSDAHWTSSESRLVHASAAT